MTQSNNNTDQILTETLTSDNSGTNIAVVQEEAIMASTSDQTSQGFLVQDNTVHLKANYAAKRKIVHNTTGYASWNIDTWAAKALRVGGFTWTTGQSAGNVSKLFWPTVLDTAQSANSHITDIIRRHARVSFHPEYEIFMNSTSFHAGLAKLAILYDSEDVSTLSDFFIASKIRTGSAINVSASQPQTFSITAEQSWINPQFNPSATSTGGFNVQHALVLNVISPLRAPTGASTSVLFSVHVRVKDIQTYLLRSPDSFNPVLAIKTRTLEEIIEQRRIPTRGHIAQGNAIMKPIKAIGGVIVDGINVVGDITNAAGGALKPVIDTGKGVLPLLPFLPFSASAMDMSGAVEVGASPGIGLTTVVAPTSHVPTNLSMEYASLANIKTVVTNVTWTTSSLTPLYESVLAPGHLGAQHSAFDFVVLRHGFCRGDVNIHIQAIKNKFQNGRLSIVVLPPNDDNVPPALADPSDIPYAQTILDLSENEEVTVHVAYPGPRPYMRTSPGVRPGPLSTSSFIYGTLRISIINPLMSNSAESSSVPLIISTTYAPNFEVFEPDQVFSTVDQTFVSSDLATTCLAALELESRSEDITVQSILAPINRGHHAQMMQQLTSPEDRTEEGAPAVKTFEGLSDFSMDSPACREKSTNFIDLLQRRRPLLIQTLNQFEHVDISLVPCPQLRGLRVIDGVAQPITSAGVDEIVQQYTMWRGGFNFELQAAMAGNHHAMALVTFAHAEPTLNAIPTITNTTITPPSLIAACAAYNNGLSSQLANSPPRRAQVHNLCYENGKITIRYAFTSTDQFKKIFGPIPTLGFSSTQFCLPQMVIRVYNLEARPLPLFLTMGLSDDFQLMGYKGIMDDINVLPRLSLGHSTASPVMEVNDRTLISSQGYAAFLDYQRRGGTLSIFQLVDLHIDVRRARRKTGRDDLAEVVEDEQKFFQEMMPVTRGHVAQMGNVHKNADGKVYIVLKNTVMRDFETDRKCFMKKLADLAQIIYEDIPKTKYSLFLRSHAFILPQDTWKAFESIMIPDIHPFEQTYRGQIVKFFGDMGFAMKTNSILAFYPNNLKQLLEDFTYYDMRKATLPWVLISEADLSAAVMAKNLDELETEWRKAPLKKGLPLPTTEGIVHDFDICTPLKFTQVCLWMELYFRGSEDLATIKRMIVFAFMKVGAKVPAWMDGPDFDVEYLHLLIKKYPQNMLRKLPQATQDALDSYCLANAVEETLTPELLAPEPSVPKGKMWNPVNRDHKAQMHKTVDEKRKSGFFSNISSTAKNLDLITGQSFQETMSSVKVTADEARDTIAMIRSSTPSLIEQSVETLTEMKDASNSIKKTSSNIKKLTGMMTNLTEGLTTWVDERKHQSPFSMLTSPASHSTSTQPTTTSNSIIDHLGVPLDSRFVTARTYEAITLMTVHPKGRSQALWSLLVHTAIDCGINGDLLSTLMDKLITHCTPRSTPPGERVAQMDIAPTSVVSALVLVTGTIFYSRLPKDDEIAKCTAEVAKRFADIGKLGYGVKALTETFFPKLKEIVETIVAYFCGENHHEIRLAKQLETQLDGLAAWIEQVAALNEGEAITHGARSGAYRDYLEALYDLGINFEIQIVTQNIKTALIPTIRKFNQMLQKIRTEVFVITKDDDLRYDPLCVSFFGDPGVGKSWLSRKLVFDLAERLNIGDSNVLYCRGGSDHWDNYHDQWATYIDDFGQKTDDEQFAEFIFLKSNSPYILPMASLTSKGTTFKSHFLLTSTNTPYPVPKTIYSDEAFFRRRDVLVKLVQVKTTRERDLSHLAFHLMNRRTDQPILNAERDPVVLTYNQFREFVYQRFLTSMNAQYASYPAEKLALRKYPDADLTITDEFQDFNGLRSDGSGFDNPYQAIDRFNHLAIGICKGSVSTELNALARRLKTSTEEPEDETLPDNWTKKPSLWERIRSYKQEPEPGHSRKAEGGTKDSTGTLYQDCLSDEEDEDFDFVQHFDIDVTAISCGCGNTHATMEEMRRCNIRAKLQKHARPLTPPPSIDALIDWAKAKGYWIEQSKNSQQIFATVDDQFNNCILFTNYLGAFQALDDCDELELPIALARLDELYIGISKQYRVYADLSPLQRRAFLNKCREQELIDRAEQAQAQIEEIREGLLARIKRIILQFWKSHPALTLLGTGLVAVASYMTYRFVKKFTNPEEDDDEKQAESRDLSYDRKVLQKRYRVAECSGCTAMTYMHYIAEQKDLTFSKREQLIRKADGIIGENCYICDDYLEQLDEIFAYIKTARKKMWAAILGAIGASFLLGAAGAAVETWWKGKKAEGDGICQAMVTHAALLKTFKDTKEDFEYMIGMNTAAKQLIKLAKTCGCEDCAWICKIKPNKDDSLTELVEKFSKPTKTAESCLDPNARAVADKNLDFQFHILNETRGTNLMAFCLTQNLVVMPRHFLDTCQEGDEMRMIGSKARTVLFSFTMKRWLNRHKFDIDRKHGLSDWGIYAMDGSWSPQEGCLDQFITEGDLALIKGRPGLMAGRDSKGYVFFHHLSEIKFMLNGECYTTANAQTYVTVRGIAYKASTQAGDCGALIYVYNPRCQRKLVGFHTNSDNKSEGGGYLITRDMFLPYLKRAEGSDGIPLPSIPLDFIDIYEKGMVQIPPFTNIEPLGVLPREMAVYIPERTAIRKSLIHGVFPVKTAPAVLTPKDSRFDAENNPTPLQQGVLGWAQEIKPHRHHLMNKAFEIASLVNERETKPLFQRRLLTWEETINGPKEISDLSKPIDMTTSPGYPWMNKRTLAGKLDFFTNISEEQEPYYIMKDDLFAAVLNREQAALKGKRVLSYWIDMLKDERRPKEKIPVGKTRNFVIGPIDYTILFRKYFYAYLLSTQGNAASHPCKVGVNPLGPDWTTIFNRMTAVGPHIIAGDYTKFDRTESGEYMRRFADLVNRWYDDGPDNARVRFILMEEASHRLTITGNVLSIVNQGLPSGFPATSPGNGSSNFGYLAYNFLELLELFKDGQVPEGISEDAERLWRHALADSNKSEELSKMNPEEGFVENTEIATYGDDLKAAVSKKILPIFNFETNRANFAKYGIIFTPEDKDVSNAKLWKKPSEATFLKRTSIPHKDFPKCILAPMEWNVITEECNWIKECSDYKDATRQVCEAAIRDAYHHGRSKFNKLKKTINQSLCRAEIDPIYLSYESLDRDWLRQFGYDYSPEFGADTTEDEQEPDY